MTTPTPPNDSSSLLVPIHVDALSVDPTSQQPFNIATPDYNNLTAFDSPLPTFVNPVSPHEQTGASLQGIHLHWALPDALTHGGRARDGAPRVILDPNTG